MYYLKYDKHVSLGKVVAANLSNCCLLRKSASKALRSASIATLSEENYGVTEFREIRVFSRVTRNPLTPPPPPPTPVCL